MSSTESDSEDEQTVDRDVARVARDQNLGIISRSCVKRKSATTMPQSQTKRLALATQMAKNINQHTFNESHRPQIDYLKSKIQYCDKSGKREFNTNLAKLKEEVNMDTVAVGITKTGEIVVACNKKTRDIVNKQKSQKYFNYSNFGIGNKNEIRDVIRNNFPEAKHCEITMVEPKKMPKTMQDNAKPHAEMQILKYSKKAGKSIVVGVSKPECSQCHNTLEDHGIPCSSVKNKKQNKNPKNWDHPDNINIKNGKIAKKPRVTTYHNFGNNLKSIKSIVKSAYTPQFSKPKMPQNYKDAVKSTLKQMKPVCRVSLGRTLESIIEDHDKKGQAKAGTLVAQAGTYKGRGSRGAYARAVTAEASASYSVFSAAARGPGASAGVHAGISGVSAMATAEVARAEASAAGVSVGVGLSLDTGASIGVDGVSASAAGFGFSIGPKMGIKTPIIDFNCSIM